MPLSGADKKPGKRRVPDSLRRRTQVSCDRCKRRRIRCVRANENESCSSCRSNGVECESTMPRKQRVYGSIESLSLRYRALDALVRGLFPDEDTDEVEVLFRLAKSRNIAMPNPDDEAPAPEAFNQSSPATARSQSDAVEPPPYRPDLSVSEIVQERMIPGPHRILHYVGPSSTSDFASIIRQLVAKQNQVESESRVRDDDRGKQAAGKKDSRSGSLHPAGRKHQPLTGDDHEPASSSEKQSADEENPIPGETKLRQLLIASLPYRPTPDTATAATNAAANAFRDLLPEKKLCDTLVQAYFDHLHSPFQVFHKAAFMGQYGSLWRAGTSQTQTPEPGWVCSLFMVIILGASILGPEQCPDSLAIQTRYFGLIRERIESIAFTASLVNVQALLLLQLYEHNSGERNTAWLFLGLAGRMAITLGMHREGTYTKFDGVESHTRRIVWWTLYHFDQSIASILARPTIIDNKEVNVRLPDDNVLDGRGYPQGFQEQTLTLMDIAVRVKRLVASISAKYDDEAALLSSAVFVEQLLQELDAWKAQLPPQLMPEPHSMPPHHCRPVLILNAIYAHYRSVLTRPFLACKVNRQIDRFLQCDNPTLSFVTTTTESLGRECQVSASTVLDYFLELSRMDLLESVGWTDFYYICHGVLATSMGALGRPHDAPRDPEDEIAKSKITAIIDIAHTRKMAPTYKVFCAVCFGLANSVGLGNEDRSPGGKSSKHEEVAEMVGPVDPFGHVNVSYGQVFGSSGGTFPTSAQPPGDSAMLPPGLLRWPLTEEMDVHLDWWNLGDIQIPGPDYMQHALPYPGSYDAMGLMTEQPNWPR